MEKQQLAPDPGPQPRKPKPVSSLGCLSAMLIVFGASGVLLVAWIAGKMGLQFVDKLKPPHVALYQNETWAQVTNHSAVVRPLVSGDDRFDIIATVWLRGNASQQAAYQEDRYPDAASELVEDSKDTHIHRQMRIPNSGELSVWLDEGVRPTKAQDDIFEVALYSGIIFQNATLSDKGLTAEVPLEFPLEVFLEQNLTAEHLRASFVVSPSVKMDHLRNFSSWMPDYVLETQWRSRPASSTKQKSLIDKAIDSFSLSVPMIEFHPIMSHCDVMLKAAGFNNTTPAHNQPWGSNARRHPHVTSRLHLRILNEQHLFNLEAYNTVHDKLQNTSCGQKYNLGKGLPHRSVCSRTYEEVGPMETRLEFSDSHHGETEWAYAPFLSAALNAAGPLDYLPVPVNRVNCSAQTSYNSTNLPAIEPALLNDTMKVIWHVSFSGRTPRKMLFSDLTAFAPTINASQSELERIEAQVQFEHQNTLRAHRFHADSHPRRRLVAYTLGSLSDLFALFLQIVYYWRLISTVGISIRGQWLSISSFLALTVELMFNPSDFAEKIVLGCFYIAHLVIPLFAITRMGFSWRGFTRPPTTFAHATHAERASSRIDAKSSWRFIGTSMLILAMCLYLADPFQHVLIPSPLPPDPEATARSTADNIFSVSVTATYWMSEVLQLLLNHRARRFGGMYKATVWLRVAERVLHFIVYLPAILGHIPDRAPLSLGTVIQVLPLLAQAWQAWTLPTAKAEEEEEHEN
ncbi:hypothetical protein MSAN_02024000 [Mycena sanguinolenta]|uniref:Uncharacterized protein n=1 Tax=Mycena sanguinolenta TaxID=230812 RepID=A0A8H6XLV3_9AGAR|nr:hypothetical protein MSAN_02024000 [Mycena sanguinolenta]